MSSDEQTGKRGFVARFVIGVQRWHVGQLGLALLVAWYVIARLLPDIEHRAVAGINAPYRGLAEYYVASLRDSLAKMRAPLRRDSASWVRCVTNVQRDSSEEAFCVRVRAQLAAKAGELDPLQNQTYQAAASLAESDRNVERRKAAVTSVFIAVRYSVAILSLAIAWVWFGAARDLTGRLKLPPRDRA
jgi:hypothetical protein